MESAAQVFAPAEVANLTGFDPDTLRVICNQHFRPFLDAERQKTRPRQYTGRDVQILTLVYQMHHTERLTYPDIVQRFQLYGVDKCLQDALGANALAAVYKKDNEALQARQMALQQELESARDLVARLRAFQAQAHVAAGHLDRRLNEFRTQLTYVLEAAERAADKEAQAVKELAAMGIMGYLFGGKKAVMVRLEHAIADREAQQTKLAELQTSIQAFQTQELMRMLGRPVDEDAGVINVDTAAGDGQTAPA